MDGTMFIEENLVKASGVSHVLFASGAGHGLVGHGV